MYAEIISELRRGLPAHLPAFLVAQRWFGGKARQILEVEIVDAIPISGGDETSAILLVVTVKYLEGAEETYSIPVSLTGQPGGEPDERAIPKVKMGNGSVLMLEDAFSRRPLLDELLSIIQQEGEMPGEKGRLRGFRTAAFTELFASSKPLPPRPLTGEQSNSSAIYCESLILKFFRRIENGENPDLEIGRFLTERAHLPHVPRIAGYIEYQVEEGTPATQAILQEFVSNQGDAWRYALKTLSAFYEGAGDFAPEREDSGLEERSEFTGEAMTRLLAEMGLLGRRTAELHLALSSENNDAAFAPERFTMEFQKSLETSFADLTRRTLGLLLARMANVPEEYREKAAEIAARERDILGRFQTGLSAPLDAMRVRIHGDYHLGQVLYTGCDFVIIDFEGEPARSLAERRVKQSPLQDVAGMLRSFHYAAFAPLLAPSANHSISPKRMANMSRWAEAWSRCAANRFLGQYYETSGAAPFLPAGAQARAKLLEVYLLGKAVYELGYELNNRPAWVGIPLEGISRLLSAG
jgi:trehalose synthase-fused probable maltokinase